MNKHFILLAASFLLPLICNSAEIREITIKPLGEAYSSGATIPKEIPGKLTFPLVKTYRQF